MPNPASLVLEFPPSPPAASAAHFREALSRSTDPSDVHADLAAGRAGFVLLDARSPEASARGHVPSAVNLPHLRIEATRRRSSAADGSATGSPSRAVRG